MSTPYIKIKNQSSLRLAAERMLREGMAPPTNGWMPGVDALALLHELACRPETANDALKLLHELQVHQVELDLQQEDLEQSQHELAADLERYAGLFAFAPLGLINTDSTGRVIEANVAASRLLGSRQEQLVGHHLASFLAPDSRLTLTAMLSRLQSSGTRQICAIQTMSNEQVSRALQLAAGPVPDRNSVLLVVNEADLWAPDTLAS